MMNASTRPFAFGALPVPDPNNMATTVPTLLPPGVVMGPPACDLFLADMGESLSPIPLSPKQFPLDLPPGDISISGFPGSNCSNFPGSCRMSGIEESPGSLVQYPDYSQSSCFPVNSAQTDLIATTQCSSTMMQNFSVDCQQNCTSVQHFNPPALPPLPQSTTLPLGNQPMFFPQCSPFDGQQLNFDTANTFTPSPIQTPSPQKVSPMDSPQGTFLQPNSLNVAVGQLFPSQLPGQVFINSDLQDQAVNPPPPPPAPPPPPLRITPPYCPRIRAHAEIEEQTPPPTLSLVQRHYTYPTVNVKQRTQCRPPALPPSQDHIEPIQSPMCSPIPLDSPHQTQAPQILPSPLTRDNIVSQQRPLMSITQAISQAISKGVSQALSTQPGQPVGFQSPSQQPQNPPEITHPSATNQQTQPPPPPPPPAPRSPRKNPSQGRTHGRARSRESLTPFAPPPTTQLQQQPQLLEQLQALLRAQGHTVVYKHSTSQLDASSQHPETRNQFQHTQPLMTAPMSTQFIASPPPPQHVPKPPAPPPPPSRNLHSSRQLPRTHKPPPPANSPPPPTLPPPASPPNSVSPPTPKSTPEPPKPISAEILPSMPGPPSNKVKGESYWTTWTENAPTLSWGTFADNFKKTWATDIDDFKIHICPMEQHKSTISKEEWLKLCDYWFSPDFQLDQATIAAWKEGWFYALTPRLKCEELVQRSPKAVAIMHCSNSTSGLYTLTLGGGNSTAANLRVARRWPNEAGVWWGSAVPHYQASPVPHAGGWYFLLPAPHHPITYHHTMQEVLQVYRPLLTLHRLTAYQGHPGFF
ncbi:hypothetical protein Pelo_9582 [Pelomyxa schiedti]|nr:hypothetical protein Pelo_9582 [Pelomyxa schiedti]